MKSYKIFYFIFKCVVDFNMVTRNSISSSFNKITLEVLSLIHIWDELKTYLVLLIFFKTLHILMFFVLLCAKLIVILLWIVHNNCWEIFIFDFKINLSNSLRLSPLFSNVSLVSLSLRSFSIKRSLRNQY